MEGILLVWAVLASWALGYVIRKWMQEREAATLKSNNDKGELSALAQALAQATATQKALEDKLNVVVRKLVTSNHERVRLEKKLDELRAYQDLMTDRWTQEKSQAGVTVSCFTLPLEREHHPGDTEWAHSLLATRVFWKG